MVRRALCVLAPVLLAACAPVGPDYHGPQSALVTRPAVSGPFVSAKAAVDPAMPLPDRWWRLYDDPVLDGLIEQALAANTDLRVADAHLARSMALLGEARARRQVQGGFSSEVSEQQRSAEQVLSHVQPPERPLYDMGITLGYDLDLFGGLRRGIEAASAEGEAAQAARDLVRVAVAAETARAWSDICNGGSQMAAMERIIAAQREDLALNQQIVAKGRLPAFEAEKRQEAVEASNARLPQIQARRRNAAFRLATLIGRPPEEFDPGWFGCNRPLALKQPLPVGDGAALLRRRPDIRMAERRIAADTARVGVAMSALYPDIRLGASIGSTGAVVDRFSPLTNRFALGPQIRWTINRSAVRARIAGARAGVEADLAGFDGTVLKALREVESALNTYAADLDRLRALEQAQKAAALVAEKARMLRAGGRVGAMPVVAADRDLALADQALADAHADINTDQIAAFLALGGGWEGRP
ncbi:efflux transporter outer membrane subunit [Novosphingobium humi]|uniref:Efflux transporter outer membrane subunit n=1 Tax=Novosphingobium humi TaxID=2282397 RepID=A0ABY7U203_9SPHN|nr:efflux transporter outer membrane subunit [Novosphingobium humi]WCT79341.1 efflux transporter outer membrane subunit [Novosphingobium humi]